MNEHRILEQIGGAVVERAALRERHPRTHAGSEPVGRSVLPVARPLARMGAICAWTGSVLGVLGHLLHGTAGVTSEGLQQLAAHGQFRIYLVDHLGLAFALLLLLAAMTVIAKAMSSEPAASWVYFGRLTAIVGGTLVLVAVAIDGFAMVDVAQAWTQAPEPVDRIALFHGAFVLWFAFARIFGLGILIFFGCSQLCYAMAFLAEGGEPRWLAPVAFLGGAIGVVLGVIMLCYVVSYLTYAILFGATAALLSAWTSAAGVRLWQATNADPSVHSLS